jgi:GNAT superfamily N-acetyltransferase
VEIAYSHDRSKIQRDRLHRVLAATYWSPNIRRDVFERALENSLIIGAYATESTLQIGYARMVTDQATFAWLADVWVDEDYRKRGVATAMCHKLIELPELATCRRVLLGTKDAHAVYRKLGFTEPEPGRLMALMRPSAVWKEL